MSDTPSTFPRPARDPLADARLAAIIESSFDAIIGKDLDSVIVSWNRAAERLFGWTAEEAVGRKIFMLIPEALAGEEAEIIGRIKRGERLESYETVRLRKDGTAVEISITVSPIRDETGQIVGASKVARDITPAKESQRRIELLLQEVNHRVKNQFAVMLSILNEIGKTTASVPEFQAAFRQRLMGLARSQDLLVSVQWSGVRLDELVRGQVAPFGDLARLSCAGPAIELQPVAVQYLGLALHELATNAAKYGALSATPGRIETSWGIDRLADRFTFTWRETGPTVGTPTPRSGEAPDAAAPRAGFGTTVLTRATPLAFHGEATLTRSGERLEWTLMAPVRSVLAAQ